MRFDRALPAFLGAVLALLTVSKPSPSTACEDAVARPDQPADFTLEVSTQPQVQAGAGAKLVIELKPAAGRSINTEDPASLSADADLGLAIGQPEGPPRTADGGTVASESTGPLRFVLPYTSNEDADGELELRARAVFFICAEDWCARRVAKASTTVAVTPSEPN